MSQTTTPTEMAIHEASFAAKAIKNAILAVNNSPHDAIIYLEQAEKFLASAKAFARQASREAMVERPPSAAPKSRPSLTLVHSKEIT